MDEMYFQMKGQFLKQCNYFIFIRTKGPHKVNFACEVNNLTTGIYCALHINSTPEQKNASHTVKILHVKIALSTTRLFFYY